MTLRHDGSDGGPLDLAPLDPVLLDAYLANQCTIAQHARISEWVAAGSGRRALLEGMRRGVVISDEDMAALPSIERTRAALRARTTMDRASAGTVKRAPLWTWRPAMMGVAAAGVVIAAVAVARMSHRDSDVRSERSYMTTVGERARVTLADGSHVTLAPQTTLHVAVRADRSRVVSLTGEAYFDVPSVSSAPFVVIAGHTTTRVLGTAFGVRHYADETHVRIAVASGKVAVQGNGDARTGARSGVGSGARSLILSAGTVGDVTDSGAVSMTMADLAPYIGWADDQMVFRNAPTQDVLAALSRWYGYEFRLSDSALAQRHLTAGISTVSSAEALSTLKILLRVDLSFNGNVVTLKPRTGRAMPAPSHHEMLDDTRTREVGR